MHRLYTPKERPMRVAAFISGSGSDLEHVIQHQLKLNEGGEFSFAVVKIFTDNNDKDNNALKIGERFNIPVETDLKPFKPQDEIDSTQRREYFKAIADKLTEFKIDVIVLADYNVIITEPILSMYEGRIINIHPSDLSIKVKGRPKYTGPGLKSIESAILDGQKVLKATTHLVIAGVDQGSILIISEPLEVILPKGISIAKLKLPENQELLKKIVRNHQERLKRVGDWIILPLTVELFSKGIFEMDSKGKIHLRKADPTA